jgi:hypothetical protein
MNAGRLMAVALAALAGCTTPPECRTESRPLHIAFLEERTDPDWFTGTWSSTGAVDDAGATAIEVAFEGVLDPPRSLPAAGVLEHRLAGKAGTLQLRTRAAIVWSSDRFPDHTAHGPFAIVGGTGVYEGLQGRGTATVTMEATPVESGSRRYHVVVRGQYVGEASGCLARSAR